MENIVQELEKLGITGDMLKMLEEQGFSAEILWELVKLGITPDNIEEKMLSLMDNGTLVGIVMTLNMYKSLSAPEISKIMGIKKTTLHNYLNHLEEDKYIQMDEERSHDEWKKLGARARKYYQPTILSKIVFDQYSNMTDSFEDIRNQIDELPEILSQEGGREAKMVAQIQSLAKEPMNLEGFVNMASQMNNAIMNISYQELSKLIVKARKGATEEELTQAVKKSIFSSKTAINIHPFFIDLYTNDQAVEYLKTFWQFQLDITKMKERFDEENKKNGYKGHRDTQYMFTFSAPVRTGDD
ncbi:MAG: MarR family transcriptional regulator [Candidatus Heimdallarchaeota archaeon]|nr:MarR family transcriptional regulator [Candidatus Heimdallarchaeota archaeon]